MNPTLTEATVLRDLARRVKDIAALDIQEQKRRAITDLNALRSDRPLVTSAGAAWLALCGWAALSLAWADHPAPTALGAWIAGAALLLVANGWDPAEVRQTAGETALLVAAGSSAVCFAQTASGARLWNNANVLCLSIRRTSQVMAGEILDSWFGTQYEANEVDDACLAQVEALDADYRST